MPYMDAMHHVFASFHKKDQESVPPARPTAALWLRFPRIRLGPSWLITWHVFFEKNPPGVEGRACIDRYMYPIYKELIS